MGMNMSEKILARHAGLDHVEPGQLVTLKCRPTKVEQQQVTTERYTRPGSYSNHPEWRNAARLSGFFTHGTAVPCILPIVHGISFHACP